MNAARTNGRCSMPDRMRRMVTYVTLGASAMLAGAGRQPDERPAVELRFGTADVYLNAGAREFAAYQVELRGAESVKLIGIEGGEGAFGEPPLYDPEALQGGRVILAAFLAEGGGAGGRVRVATLHYTWDAARDAAPQWRATPRAAAEADGTRFEGAFEVRPRPEAREP